MGGVKANIGHAEPAAGMTGRGRLALGLRAREAAPNAQLRALNPHVGGALRGALATLTAPEITRRLSFLYGKIDGLKHVCMVMVQELAKRKEEEGGGGSSSSDAPHSKAAPQGS